MKYWSQTAIVTSPLVPNMLFWEVSQWPRTGYLSKAGANAVFQVADSTSPTECPNLALQDDGAGMARRVFLRHPDDAEFRALERGGVHQDDVRCCIYFDALH